MQRPNPQPDLLVRLRCAVAYAQMQALCCWRRQKQALDLQLSSGLEQRKTAAAADALAFALAHGTRQSMAAWPAMPRLASAEPAGAPEERPTSDPSAARCRAHTAASAEASVAVRAAAVAVAANPHSHCCVESGCHPKEALLFAPMGGCSAEVAGYCQAGGSPTPAAAAAAAVHPTQYVAHVEHSQAGHCQAGDTTTPAAAHPTRPLNGVARFQTGRC